MVVSIAQAQSYFDTRLNTGPWDSSSGGNKVKALAQAERQVLGLNLSNSIPGDMLANAICEQALFLLSLTPADLERIRARQLGVGFRWVGDARENYVGAVSMICPEAEGLLKPFINIYRRMGHIR